MKLSEETRLLLYNQYEILKTLSQNQYEKEGYELKQTIVSEGYEFNYDELGDYSNIVNPKLSQFVFRVLSMVNALQVSYSNLTPGDQSKIDKRDLRFRGFDGNKEGELYSYSRFVIEGLDRYRGIDIEDFNSHCNMKETYDDMIVKWEKKYNENYKSLRVEDIKDIIDRY